MTLTSLYLRAHFSNSTTSAVTLAEHSRSPDDIKFARNLIYAKMTPGNPELGKKTLFEGNARTKRYKYSMLINKVAAIQAAPAITHLAKQGAVFMPKQ